MDLDLDLDSIFNGFGSGFGFKCVLGLDWILDLKKFMDLDLDLDLFLDMDSNPNPRIQIRTSLIKRPISSFIKLQSRTEELKMFVQTPRDPKVLKIQNVSPRAGIHCYKTHWKCKACHCRMRKPINKSK